LGVIWWYFSGVPNILIQCAGIPFSSLIRKSSRHNYFCMVFLCTLDQMLGHCFEICQFLLDLFKINYSEQLYCIKKVKQNTQNPFQSLVRTNGHAMVCCQSVFIRKEGIPPETEK
jgi:hypothetical protein